MQKPSAIQPNETFPVHTGVALHIADPSLCAIVAPRSGLGIKHGIILANTIGVIDSDYQGEIICFVWNRSEHAYILEPYMRICQLMFMPVVHRELVAVDEFSIKSSRGEGGFGSTGTS